LVSFNQKSYFLALNDFLQSFGKLLNISLSLDSDLKFIGEISVHGELASQVLNYLLVLLIVLHSLGDDLGSLTCYLVPACQQLLEIGSEHLVPVWVLLILLTAL